MDSHIPLDNMSKLSKKFDKALSDLSASGEVTSHKYLLGVSGGIDSITMAELFFRSPLKPSFAIAHVNFSLRAESSDADAEFVREWSADRGIKAHFLKVDTKEYAHSHCQSTQMAAREIRYNWFEKLCSEYGYDYICIAHNRDDVVETILLNLTRGTGIKGIGGIPATNGKIIRPLLNFSRQEIEEYAALNRYGHRDDHTNFESHYARNRIRNIIIPEFRKINPSFSSTMKHNGEIFAQAAEVLENLYLQKRELFCREDKYGTLHIDTAALAKEGNVEYWLYMILRDFKFNSSQIADIEEAIGEEPGRLFQSEKHTLATTATSLVMLPTSELHPVPIEITGCGRYSFGGREFELELFEDKGYLQYLNKNGIHCIDATETIFPITCRSWKNGDRFFPFGMKGSKKISDFYKDLKIDCLNRDRIPVLCSKGDIISIVGLRSDERFRVRDNSRRVLVVKSLY